MSDSQVDSLRSIDVAGGIDVGCEERTSDAGKGRKESKANRVDSPFAVGTQWKTMFIADAPLRPQDKLHERPRIVAFHFEVTVTATAAEVAVR